MRTAKTRNIGVWYLVFHTERLNIHIHDHILNNFVSRMIQIS